MWFMGNGKVQGVARGKGLRRGGFPDHREEVVERLDWIWNHQQT